MVKANNEPRVHQPNLARRRAVVAASVAGAVLSVAAWAGASGESNSADQVNQPGVTCETVISNECAEVPTTKATSSTSEATTTTSEAPTTTEAEVPQEPTPQGPTPTSPNTPAPTAPAGNPNSGYTG